VWIEAINIKSFKKQKYPVERKEHEGYPGENQHEILLFPST